MLLTYYTTKSGKYYEIVQKNKKNVYIHFGRQPRVGSLPFGRFEVYKFNTQSKAKEFKDKK
tara:strand:- start:178 stop:360 length:183 start_codon:yes stop_codon:yes gene_type:complete